MSFGSVVRSIFANVAPFGVLRTGYGGVIGFGSTAVIGASPRWAAGTTVGLRGRPVSPWSTGCPRKRHPTPRKRGLLRCVDDPLHPARPPPGRHPGGDAGA